MKKIVVLFVLLITISITACNKTRRESVSCFENSERNILAKDKNNISTEETQSTQEIEETQETEELRLQKKIIKLTERVTVLNQIFASYQANVDENGFYRWLYENYGSSLIDRIVEGIDNNTYNDQDFYTLTGKSIYVLVDEFLGKNENDGIYARQSDNKEYANLLFAGDLCLEEDGFVIDQFDKTGILSDCIHEKLLEQMKQADIFMLNHEYCISERGNPLKGKYYTFRAKPSRMDLLTQMSADIVSLANNHVYDYGADALYDTFNLLNGANIPFVGAGENWEKAQRPVFFVVNGMKIGFVAASRAEKYRYTPQATETTPGIVLMYDTTNINEIISKASNECDYLIAYIHWGTEDSNQYETYQHNIAKELFDSGADIIIGGHPHVLQGMEYIDGKPVIYSLGDFWFNGETKYTGMLNLKVDINGLKEMKFVPCLQTNYTTQYIENAEKQKELFDYLQNLSYNITINDDGFITNN